MNRLVMDRDFLRKTFSRPEFGALGGALIVWLFFVIIAGDRGFLTLRGTATFLEVGAELGILAVAVSALMIGGEFDLSIGSTIGLTGMAMAMLTVEAGVPLPISMIIALALALAIGFLNGYIVVRSGLPSFIVTLATLFIIRGSTIGITRMVTGRTQVGGLDQAPGYEIMRLLLASDIRVGGVGFSISIVWWLLIAVLATFILVRTQFGNWIYAVGGSFNSARMMGVPVRRVKISLFMTTAVAAWFIAMIQAIAFTGADVLRGQQREFFAIIAVVIGGTLLTGGYGSAIGAALGALIFGMVRQGIVFAGVDADWFQVFMGVVLLVAVLVNTFIRSKAAAASK
ncbi:MAG: ABC transporter permease [Candidatus Marinimicrobia bacterium]|nr:ABC transporter permease [Candidatus Neomarinimicrobiota bacterium]